MRSQKKQKKELAEATRRSLRLVAEGRNEEAYDFLEQAVQRFPEDPAIRLQYATTLLAIRPNEAVSEVIKAIDLDPNEPMRLTGAAGILFKMGDVETARLYATRAKELAPPDFSFMPYLINLDAHFAALEGKDDQAEEGFRDAVEQEPDGEIFAVDLAQFLAKRGRQPEALEIIDTTLPLTKRKEPLERLRSELLGQSDAQT